MLVLLLRLLPTKAFKLWFLSGLHLNVVRISGHVSNKSGKIEMCSESFHPLIETPGKSVMRRKNTFVGDLFPLVTWIIRLRGYSAFVLFVCLGSNSPAGIFDSFLSISRKLLDKMYDKFLKYAREAFFISELCTRPIVTYQVWTN